MDDNVSFMDENCILWMRISSMDDNCILWMRMSILWMRMSRLWMENADLWMKMAAGQGGREEPEPARSVGT